MKKYFLICILLSVGSQIHPDGFDDSFCISEKLFNTILSLVPEGGTILEFGSGWSSGELSKYYTVYSIEHDSKWINKYNTNYIHAPIIKGWYDPQVFEKLLPKKYDLLLIDGPPGYMRKNFLNHLSLFNLDVILIFDDMQREEDYSIMMKIAQHLNRTPTIIKEEIKHFAILFPANSKHIEIN